MLPWTMIPLPSPSKQSSQGMLSRESLSAQGKQTGASSRISYSNSLARGGLWFEHEEKQVRYHHQ